MPQNTIVTPINAPSRKILITYKKVGKMAIQGNFNLSKSGYNWLEISNDEILKIEGVTSLKIINTGDEEVKINGIVLLPLPRYDLTKNKEIDGTTEFWELIDRAMCRNSKIFVLPDGTYSDITLNIDFLGEESNAFCNKPNLPAYPQDVFFEEVVSYNVVVSDPIPVVDNTPFVQPTYGFLNLEHWFTILKPIGASVKVLFKGINEQTFEYVIPCVLGNNLITYEVINASDDGSGIIVYTTTTVGVPLHFAGAFPLTIQFQRLDTMQFSEVFGNEWIK